MALNGLLEAGLVDEAIPKAGVSAEDVTLCFALDSGYLLPFKILLYSMCVAGTMLDCPVVIYTDDAALRDDPVVGAVADRVVLADPASGEDFEYLRRHCLKRRERDDWHRGTFLKWRLFEPQATGRALFLDADMLCLRPLEPILAAARDADLAVCPQFQKWIRTDDAGAAHPPERIDATLAEMAQGVYAGGHRSRVNSGMMLVGDRLLSADFLGDLIEKSRGISEVNEQGLLSRYFVDSDRYSRRMLASTYNFQESYLRLGTSGAAETLLADIRVLHYAGARKPWSTPPNAVRRASFTLWHEFYFHARAHSRLV